MSLHDVRQSVLTTFNKHQDFFLRFLKEWKIDFDLFEHKYIEVSSLLKSQFIVYYFLIKPKFSTCSILPTIFENFFFSQLLSENYEIKKPKRVKANFFSIMVEHPYQWRILHFPWGALTYYLSYFSQKASGQWKKTWIERGVLVPCTP